MTPNTHISNANDVNVNGFCEEDNNIIWKILCLEMPIILFGGAYSLAKLSFECST